MKYSNGICKICEDAEENTNHLISKCPEVNVMWKCIEDVIHNCITPGYAITDFHRIAYMDEKLKDAAFDKHVINNMQMDHLEKKEYQ